MHRTLVIVVTYNAMIWAEKCFGSLRTVDGGVDVVALDNGSSDGTVAYLRENFPEVRLIETGSNLGFGAANNIGLRIAVEKGYEYVYLLNQDAWVLPDTIERLIEGTKKGYGLVSPMQMTADLVTMDRYFSRHCGKYLSGQETVEVPFAMAAHWLITREALLKVGGFSPAFTLYGEDENWIDRLHYFGGRLAVVPSARAVHDRAARKTDTAAAMRLKFSGCRSSVSDPSRSPVLTYCLQTLKLIGIAVRRASFIPLRYIPEFWGMRRSLMSFRKQSTNPGAFL